jgi:heme exporter protein C
VTWWRTLHQPPSIIRPDGPQIDDPLMLAALIGGTAAFTVVYAALVTKRMELDRLQLALAEARAAADTRVAGDAVIAPGLAEDWGLGR